MHLHAWLSVMLVSATRRRHRRRRLRVRSGVRRGDTAGWRLVRRCGARRHRHCRVVLGAVVHDLSSTPEVAEVAERYADQVRVIGVPGRGELDAMREFVDGTGTGAITHLADVGGSISTSSGSTANPRTRSSTTRQRSSSVPSSSSRPYALGAAAIRRRHTTSDTSAGHSSTTPLPDPVSTAGATSPSTDDQVTTAP